MKQVRPSVTKALPVYSELKATTKRLAEVMERRTAADQGRVARYASTTQGVPRDPKRAISEVYRDPEPAKAARELTRVMQRSKDPSALRGFQTLALDEFFKRNGGSAKSLSAALDAPDGKVLREVYNEDQMATLKRIISAGLRVEQGDTKTLRWASERLFSTMSAIFGAAFGRSISQFLGGGTVQTPGILSGAFRTAAEGIIGSVPPRELIANAVADPKWRKILFAKLPKDESSARTLQKHLRRAVTLTEAAEQQVEKDVTGERPNARE